ncbi:MAG: serine hydrolase domain-containing protein [Cyanobacteria bacterium P01_A01_bin.84]
MIKRNFILTAEVLGMSLILLSLNHAEATQTSKNPIISTSSIEKITPVQKITDNQSYSLSKGKQGKWIHAGTANQAIKKYRAKYNVPGISVAIAKNGKIIYAEGFGWQNVEKKIKASNSTIYRLASVSKPITAILAMEMAEQNKLLLNKNIRAYLPEKLPQYHNYRIRELLSHQSGVRHYKKGQDPTKNAKKHYLRAQDAMQLFVKDKLVIEPRSNYKYSTHGYTVLAAAMEKTANKPFFRYTRDRFRGWGLKDLSPELAKINQTNRAQIYTLKNGKNLVSQRDDLSWKYAGGGYQSSAPDLARLSIRLLNGKIISKQSLNIMWTPQKSQGRTTRYGLGWGVGTDEDGRKIVAHSGAQNGAASYWRIYPHEKVVVVVISNRRGHKPRDLGSSLGKLTVTNSITKPVSQK